MRQRRHSRGILNLGNCMQIGSAYIRFTSTHRTIFHDKSRRLRCRVDGS